MFIGFWARVPLIGRLLVMASLALFVAGSAMLFVSARQEVTEIKADLETELNNELYTLPASLAETVVLGDFVTLQQILDRQVAQPLFLSLDFYDIAGTHLHSKHASETVPEVPNWFLAMFKFSDISGRAPVNIGGRFYGDLSLTLSAQGPANRFWQHLKTHIAILLLAIPLDFLGIWLVLRSGLAPLKQLEWGASAVAAGNLDIHLTPCGSPELRHLTYAFERMAQSLLAAQLSLKQSEERLQLAISGANDGIWDWNMKTDVLYLSPRWKQMLGYDEDELPHVFDSFEQLLHPDDKARVMNILDEYLKGKIPIFSTEFRMRHKNGSTRWILGRGEALRDEHGAPYRMTGSHTDITERKYAEQALIVERNNAQRYLDVAEVILVAIDEQARIMLINRKGQQVLGYTDSELIGKDWFQACLPPDEIETTFAYYRKIISGELEPFEYLESSVLTKAGQTRLIAWHNSLLYDDAGRIIGTLSSGDDITERRRTETELERYRQHLETLVEERTVELTSAKEVAEAANRAKSVFLANMSHELRTPLNAILGFSSMMRRNVRLEQTDRDDLDLINHSGEHLLNIINDVLEMAKIETGRAELEETQFDLGAMVNDVAQMLSLRAKEKGLWLVIDPSSRFPRSIIGDEGRLRQIVINLLGNAIKFTLQGGVTLRLGTKQNAATHLLIEVQDTGPGIPVKDQQRIFEPFVQLGEHSVNLGTGLGLAITRQFVQMMEGSLTLESAPGKGSLFRVELPFKEVRDTEISLTSVEQPKGEVIGLLPGQPVYRILIVEDQLENQLLIKRLMENIGFEIKVAENGERAIQLFQSWHPQLILMDKRMPVMDGLEATEAIRRLQGGKEAKIVAVTASAFKEQRDEMLNAGIDDCVRKPYRFDEIYECLTRQLGVRYAYAEAPPAEDMESVPLTSERLSQMLTVLPLEMRNELGEAFESLETERINAVIQQMANYNPSLQQRLSQLADNFDYSSVLKALRMISSDNET